VGSIEVPRRGSLYHEYPDYRVDLEHSSDRVRVCFNGEIIADSSCTLIVREMELAPVVYFPRHDVRFDLLEKTDHETFCPFKGEASYWTLRVRGRAEENVVWSYEEPFEQVAGLEGYVAFYQDRVEWRDGR
jgi:uncharacterized protein (DUF427 family)